MFRLNDLMFILIIGLVTENCLTKCLHLFALNFYFIFCRSEIVHSTAILRTTSHHIKKSA